MIACKLFAQAFQIDTWNQSMIYGTGWIYFLWFALVSSLVWHSEIFDILTDGLQRKDETAGSNAKINDNMSFAFITGNLMVNLVQSSIAVLNWHCYYFVVDNFRMIDEISLFE